MPACGGAYFLIVRVAGHALPLVVSFCLSGTSPTSSSYWTLSVTVVVWVMIPLVAVTVTIEVPTGVPGSPLPPPPPPPPQPAIVIRNAKAIRLSNLHKMRRLDAPPSKKTPASVAPKLVVHQPQPFSFALWAAVVVMVSVVEPLPVTAGGLKLHVLSRGKPEHDAPEKLMVPVYPG